MQRTNDEQDRPEQYTKPEIADYGDLVEQTAHGATGGHADKTIYYGEVPTFLSVTP
jgi:hypothetical protein